MSHFDLAILYKALFPLREAPSVPSIVSYTHYATPLWANKNGASPSRRTAYQSGHTHAVVALRLQFRLRMSESVDLQHFERADSFNLSNTRSVRLQIVQVLHNLVFIA